MWKLIPEFNNYEISTEGMIRNISSNKILNHSFRKSGKGTPVVSLVNQNGTSVLEVRYLMACTFLNVDINERPKPKIEYINGNPHNNGIHNIRVKTSESLEDEEWKPISDFETSYAISNKGRVKRIARVDKYVRKDTGKEVERYVSELILKPIDNQGYYEINLREKEKNSFIFIHRLVAKAFLPAPESNDMNEINHKDGNKHNNCVDNLEWCSRRQNVEHSVATGLRSSSKGTDRTQKAIKCLETGQIFKNAKEAAAAFNIPYSYLMDRMHEGKECHGYHFEQVKLDIRVKCLDTGEIFSTLSEVKEKLGLDVADSIKRRTCIDGWTFCYLRDNVDEEEYLKECRNRYSQWPRANKRWEETK